MRTEENFCRQFASEKVNFFRNLKKRIASLILHLLNYVPKHLRSQFRTLLKGRQPNDGNVPEEANRADGIRHHTQPST